MASSKTISCGPCQEGKVTTKADLWCNNCDEGLCATCSGHHKRSKSSCDHTTIDIKSYKPSIQAIQTECEEHGQQLNLYCPVHLMPCCDKCSLTNHSKCTGITSLASVVQKTKMEKSKESVHRDINSILDILNKMVINKSENVKRGEQQCDSIKGRIIKFRKKINEHLDKLEQNLCQETDTILNKEKSKASDLITELEEKGGKLDVMKDYLHEVTTHSSKLHSFLGVHQIEQQVHQCQRYVDDLEDDERTKEFDFKMKQNDEIKKTLIELESLESLGDVMVVKTNIPINRKTSVRRKAQVHSRQQSNINEMTMNIETKIDFNIGNWIRDMICLIDGRVIVVKQFGTVNLLKFEGTLNEHFPISGEAYSVTQINQNTIAIMYPQENAIKIFNIENESVTKVINLDQACYGLSYSNYSLAIGCIKDKIHIIDLEGNTLKSIKVECKSRLANVVYLNNRVIYSDFHGKAVYCYDESGEQIWQYKQGLEGPQGLCTDSYGNIIVADIESKRLIGISKDGQNSKVLISKEDDLKYPQCICFEHNGTSGYIGDYLGKHLVKFNLSYE